MRTQLPPRGIGVRLENGSALRVRSLEYISIVAWIPKKVVPIRLVLRKGEERDGKSDGGKAEVGHLLAGWNWKGNGSWLWAVCCIGEWVGICD